MSLSPGTHLGAYEVLSALGAGGMGEVYRARDTKLGRDVAVKVLPADVTADGERLARFRREAQLLAALNHPNVAAIYGLDEAGGVPFLVLELVEGEDLARRIARGPLPVDEAVDIAEQIAAGLEAAHGKGIVHRDLKPANVKLAPDGKVKVLDFGLAKAWTGEPGPASSGGDLTQSPTLAYAGTQAGVILGTAAYMSPEQARGKRVDQRADIWALGVVLWEMLTGSPLFSGETVSDVIAVLLTRDLPWESLPAQAAHLRGVLEVCLERDPHRRMRDAGDVRLELERAQTRPPATPGASAAIVGGTGTARVLGIVVVTAVAAALAGALGGHLLWRPAPVHRTPRALSIQLDGKQALSGGADLTMTFSPDGQTLVFVGAQDGRRGLFQRRLDAPGVTRIDGTDHGSAPFFSPDGRWLGFSADGHLRKVALAGGRPFDLADQRGVGGSYWLESGDIVFAPTYSDGLFRMSAEGGAAKRLTTPDRAHGELGHWWPALLPGGRDVLFTGFKTPVDTSRVAVLSLETGKVRDVLDGGFFGRYVAFEGAGYLLYAKGHRLYAAPFDPGRAVLTGPSRAVLDDLATNQTSGFGVFDVSPDGTLAYVAASVIDTPNEILWVERDGRTRKAVADDRQYQDLSLSPDGKQVAVTIQGDSLDVWTLAIAQGTLSRLTSMPGTEFQPFWSADSREVFFVVDRPPFELHAVPFGTSAPEHPLFPEPAELDTQTATVSPDGRLVAYVLTPEGTGNDIFVRPVDGSEKARAFRATRATERFPAFSPDGRYLAYESDETGRTEVYVDAYPGPGEHVQISADGGEQPVWTRGSGEIFYRHEDEMRVVAVRTQPTFGFEPPRTLFRMAAVVTTNESRTYDVTADGQRVLVIHTPESRTPRRIDVVTGWVADLARRMAERK